MSSKELVILIFLFTHGQALTGNVQNEEAVGDKIFQFYNKKFRPVSNRRTRTIVYISPILTMITNVDEKEGTLTYGHWLSLYNPEWNITGYEVKMTTDFFAINGENNSFNNVIYTLKFSRLPNYFLFTMVGPSFIITMIALVGLFSPSNSDGQRQERVTIGLTTLLTMAVMLNIVCDQMPKSSLETSLLGRFVFYEMVMTSICTCISVFVLNWHEKAVADGWGCKKGGKTTSNGRRKCSEIPYMVSATCCMYQKLTFNEAIDGIEKMLEEHKNSKEKEAMWSKVFCRIDCALLVLALVANMILGICMLGKGSQYSFGV